MIKMIKNEQKIKFNNMGKTDHQRKYYLVELILLAMVFCIISCDTDYNKLSTNDSEQSGLGKIQSLTIMSGVNKVSVTGVIEDPNVSEVRIYWNDESDFVSVPVNNAIEADTINVVIENLEEKLYVFEVKTFDEAGNSSVAVSGGAEVFSTDFVNTIENRGIVSSTLKGNALDVIFDKTNFNDGILYSEFNYVNTEGENKMLLIDKEELGIRISDFKIGSKYTYRTAIIPSPVAIDTFYTDYDSFSPFEFPVLKNASSFVRSSWDGKRWGILADWISNDAVKTHNGYGGYDSKNGFNVESGWGAPAITNGKIYQTVMAGPTNYSLNVILNGGNHSINDEGGLYVVVAKGDGLPNVEDLATAPEVLGYARIISSNLSYNVDFTVDESLEISVGIVTTQGTEGRFAPFKSFKLVPGN
jgi:hypothetical protein